MADNQPGTIITPGAEKAETSWQFHDEQNPAPNNRPEQQSVMPSGAVTWTASEFIAHDKSGSWYGLLAVGAIILAGIVYLISSGDKVSTGVVIIVAIVFGILAARKPRELEYSVDEQGVNISSKLYPYASFRSFAVVQEEALESIWLMPLKRFMPILTVYFDPKDNKKIVDVLSKFLPVENKQPDIVDKLMHRLRF